MIDFVEEGLLVLGYESEVVERIELIDRSRVWLVRFIVVD